MTTPGSVVVAVTPETLVQPPPLKLCSIETPETPTIGTAILKPDWAGELPLLVFSGTPLPATKCRLSVFD